MPYFLRSRCIMHLFMHALFATVGWLLGPWHALSRMHRQPLVTINAHTNDAAAAAAAVSAPAP